MDSIPLGVDFRRHLDGVIAGCRVVLVVIGDAWVSVVGDDGQRRLDSPSDHVRIEIEAALTRGIPVVPLLVRDASIPPEQDLPESLKDLVYRNGTSVRSDPDFHRDMDRVLAGLEDYFRD